VACHLVFLPLRHYSKHSPTFRNFSIFTRSIVTGTELDLATLLDVKNDVIRVVTN
jgi:hypothetical protein